MSEKVHLLEHPQQYEYPEQDPNYQGQQLEEELSNGPIDSRTCRDIPFVLLYIALWVAMIYLFKIGLSEGQPKKLLSPFDMNGNQCGYGVTENYTLGYIVSTNEYYCVNKCPQSTDNFKDVVYGNTSVTLFYSSESFFTICYPDINDKTNLEIVNQVLENSGFTKGLGTMMADIATSRWVILGSGGIAFLVSIILTFLIKLTARCVVWTMIVGYLVFTGGLGTIAFLQATRGSFSEYDYVKDQKNQKIIAYTLWTICGLSILIILCISNKINQCISVLKAASDFTRQVWIVIFVPFVMFIFVIAFVAFWLVGSIFIYSLNKEIVWSQTSPFAQIDFNTSNKYELLLFLFGVFWNLEFAQAFCQFIISSCACLWYFSHMGRDLSFPVTKSVCRGLTYHLGSLLFGSLILAIIQIIKFLLDQIHKSMKQPVMGAASPDNNPLLKCGIAYCKYLIKCFERIVRFISQNAYTMIALSGKGFCTSAYEAFYLISRNLTRVAITHGLGKIFQVIGTVFISATTTLICYLIITQTSYYKHLVISPLGPVIVFILISFVIGTLFMDLFGQGTDAILMCFLADLELSKKGGKNKGQSIPPSLAEFIEAY